MLTADYASLIRPTLFRSGRSVRDLGEFAPEETGERSHRRAAGPGFGLRVVVGVGVDVVGIDDAVSVADELDPGHLDVVCREEGFVALFEARIDVGDDRELGAW